MLCILRKEFGEKLAMRNPRIFRGQIFPSAQRVSWPNPNTFVKMALTKQYFIISMLLFIPYALLNLVGLFSAKQVVFLTCRSESENS